jgi:GNAT superfamily N-acetyltransferase
MELVTDKEEEQSPRQGRMEIRNYGPEYIQEYCDLLNAANADRPDFEETRVSDLASFLSSPYYDPGGHFLVFIEGELVAAVMGSRNIGYSVLTPEQINFTLNVLPNFRRRRIGRTILEKSMIHFKRHGMRIAVIDDVHAKCKGSIDFYTKLGFKEVSHGYWMERKFSGDIEKPTFPISVPQEYRIRPLDGPKELELFREKINEAFSDAPFFTPMDQQRFEQRYVKKPYVDLTGYFVAIHEASNSIVGTVASQIDYDYNKIKKDDFGEVRAVGVVKAHRRKGLAKCLVKQSMNWIASRGMTSAKLGTNNPEALRVYLSLGFRTLHEYIRFEKEFS